MLTDPDRLLIAAAVDGQLPPEQAGRLARLFAGSADARILASALTADRRRLADLPRLPAPAGLPEQVVASLPVTSSARRHAPQTPGWLPYTIAAGVFCAIALGSYQFAGRKERSEPVAGGPSSTPMSGGGKRQTHPELLPTPRPAPPPPVVADRVTLPTVELAPQPRPAQPPAFLTAGLFREIDAPAEVSVRPPLLVPAGELDTSDTQAQVSALWAGGHAVRLDLFAPDATAAVPAVQAAVRARGWAVGVDAVAQSLLKAKQPGTFALYVDAVSAEDAVRLFTGLAAQQRAGGKFGAAHLSVVGPAELRELKDLFGGDPKAASRSGRDDSTAKKAAPKRPALLFAVSPPTARPDPSSKEVKAFADSRAERKPGTVPLLVVVRQQDGN